MCICISAYSLTETPDCWVKTTVILVTRYKLVFKGSRVQGWGVSGEMIIVKVYLVNVQSVLQYINFSLEKWNKMPFITFTVTFTVTSINVIAIIEKYDMIWHVLWYLSILYTYSIFRLYMLQLVLVCGFVLHSAMQKILWEYFSSPWRLPTFPF